MKVLARDLSSEYAIDLKEFPVAMLVDQMDYARVSQVMIPDNGKDVTIWTRDGRVFSTPPTHEFDAFLGWR